MHTKNMFNWTNLTKYLKTELETCLIVEAGWDMNNMNV